MWRGKRLSFNFLSGWAQITEPERVTRNYLQNRDFFKVTNNFYSGYLNITPGFVNWTPSTQKQFQFNGKPIYKVKEIRKIKFYKYYSLMNTNIVKYIIVKSVTPHIFVGILIWRAMLTTTHHLFDSGQVLNACTPVDSVTKFNRWFFFLCPITLIFWGIILTCTVMESLKQSIS